jgi:hypothetical protein
MSFPEPVHALYDRNASNQQIGPLSAQTAIPTATTRPQLHSNALKSPPISVSPSFDE